MCALALPAKVLGAGCAVNRLFKKLLELYEEGGGTFAPFFLASDNPMAIACLGLVTLRPLRPERSLPCFIAFISRSTDLEAAGLYFLPGFAAVFRAVFLAAGIVSPLQLGSTCGVGGCQLPAAGLLAGAGVAGAASVLAGVLFSEDDAAPSEAEDDASAEAGLGEGLAP
jgi:hypothetical protein